MYSLLDPDKVLRYNRWEDLRTTAHHYRNQRDLAADSRDHPRSRLFGRSR